LAQRTGDLQRLWPIAAARAEAAWLRDQADAIPACVDATYELACELGLSWAIGELGLWRRRAGGIGDLPATAAEPWALHAAGRLRDAARAWQQLGAPYEAADALADSERPADLLEALRIFDELGAVVPGARVRRRLRARGVRGVPRGPRRTTVTHPAGLTPRQAEVLNLVARGLSDADIARHLHLSPKTVGHHVSAVLAKLDVSSRGEAAHRARELADAPGDAHAGDAHVPDLPGGHES
jgi:DNA-binding CsgD family transcriptional regulator